MADLGNEITNSLDRGGRGGMTGPFSIADGTLAAPGLRFTADPDNGLYRSTVNAWSMVAAGASVANLTAATFTIPAGVTFNMLGTPLGLGVAVQDAIPSPLKQGGQWWESDTGAYLMRYVNPDLTETLVALTAAGGDFIPYPLRGVANGVASLDAGTKVPIAQLPAGTANGVASLDAGAKVPVAQLPAGNIRRVYATVGINVWSKPAGLVSVDVTVVGGGGAGGGPQTTGAGTASSGGGGGGGGTSTKRILAAALGATENATVGASGAQVAGGTGGTGGTSSFGAHCSATGGAGGLSSTPIANAVGRGGSGGIGVGGDINIGGGAGTDGLAQANVILVAATGGSSTLGGGGNGVNTGGNFGGGGGGPFVNVSAGGIVGGAGAQGIVIVTEYYQ